MRKIDTTINFDATAKISAKPIYFGEDKVIALLAGGCTSIAPHICEFSIYPIMYDNNMQQYIAPEGITVFRSTEKSMEPNIDLEEIIQDIYDDTKLPILPDAKNGDYIMTVDNDIVRLHHDRFGLVVEHLKHWTNNTMLTLCSATKYEFDPDNPKIMIISKMDTVGNWYIYDKFCYMNGLKIEIKAPEVE